MRTRETGMLWGARVCTHVCPSSRTRARALRAARALARLQAARQRAARRREPPYPTLETLRACLARIMWHQQAVASNFHARPRSRRACPPAGAPRRHARTRARTQDCPSIARVRDVARPRLHDALQRQTWDSRQHNATAAIALCVHTNADTHPDKTQQHTARRGTRARRSSRVQNVTTSSGGRKAERSSRLRWWLRALRARDRGGAVSRQPATSAKPSARAHTAGARLPKKKRESKVWTHWHATCADGPGRAAPAAAPTAPKLS